jgi:hypothetical protein
MQVPEGQYPRLYDAESAVQRATTIWGQLVMRLAVRMLFIGVGLLVLVAAMLIS